MEKITGKGIPSNHLKAAVGQWYEDTDTGDIYECRIANKYSTLHGAPVGGYVWERRMRGEDYREFHGTTEDWTFTLEDDSVVTKKVVVMSE